MVVVCVIAKQATRIVAIADAFEAYDKGIIETTIDEAYNICFSYSGVSLRHGSPQQHVHLMFVAGDSENNIIYNVPISDNACQCDTI